MALPDWLESDDATAQTVRDQCGLEPHQLRAVADEAAMLVQIKALWDTHAKDALNKARTFAGVLSFPTTVAQMQTAFPDATDATAEEIAANDADRAARIEGQQDAVREAVSERVKASLFYSLPSDGQDERAKTHYINAQTQLSTLKEMLKDLRKRYRRNKYDPLI